VDLLGLGERLAPVTHPRRHDGIELVEAVHDLLPALVEPEPFAAPESRRTPSDEVGVVVQPPRGRRQRSIRASVHDDLRSTSADESRGRCAGPAECAEELGVDDAARRV
jgi:hypothetical protein